MKIQPSEEYIKKEITVTENDIQESDKIQNNPEKILQLVDLIFLCSPLKTIPS